MAHALPDGPAASSSPRTATGAGSLRDYPTALVEATLERVIASSTFRRSQRHRQFLVHVVRAGLEGRHDRLKEMIIGLEVFGRPVTDYDPRQDPIVRVEAGRIRDKLARYYDGEGAAESFQLVLPVGHYLPQLVRRKPPRAAHPGASLAVLPFTNLSGDPDDAAFAVGLADQLIDTLGRLPSLKVVARLSAAKARDGGMDLPGIGKLLGVNHVVEGSLQRSGARMRCIVHLSRTRDSVRIWSRRFDHSDDSDDLFTFQDTIADAALEAVAALQRPSGAEPHLAATATRLRPATTDSHAARDLYERARYLAQQRSVEAYEKAIVLFERAVDIDPTFAQAHSQLGAALANLTAFARPSHPGFERVKRAAHRALELDPLDGEAHALLATVAHRIDYAWSAAEPLFLEALRLAPNSTLVHSSFAWSLVFNGRFGEAMQHCRLAQELDPLNLGVRTNNAAIARFARRFDIAVQELQAALDLDPRHVFSHVILGVTWLCSGQPERALPHFDEAMRLAPALPSAAFGRICVMGATGRVAEGRQELAALLVRLGDTHYSRVNVAMAQTFLGDIDGALDSLAHAAEARDILFVGLSVDALFDRLIDEPRYIALLTRYGLPRPLGPGLQALAD